MAREYLRISKEVTYGTFHLGTTAGTDYIIVRLDQSNPYTLRPKVKQTFIRSADGLNRRVQMVGPQTELTGNLQTLLYPSVTGFLMGWAATLTSNDLGSCTIDHAIVMENGTTAYQRHLGVKVTSLQISCSADQPLARVNLGLVGQQPATITSTDFAEPALSAYPTDIPYLFQHLAGNFDVASSRTEFAMFELNVKNMIDPPFFESPYITRAQWCGRDIDLSTKFIFKTAADRAAYEANTAQSVTAEFVHSNGTNSLTLNMETANQFTEVTDDLALDKIYYQTLGLANMVDYSLGSPTDFAFTVV